MTIYRGPGGTGSANSEFDTTEYQQFLIQTQAAKEAAEAARDSALIAETNAETAATNAASSASAASTSASNAATSASNAASSATSAANSASAAAASAASINPTDIVHISGNETITGAKTFSTNPTLSAGTANCVAYLNGSKVLTTGSALTFDGTNLGVGTSSPRAKFDANGASILADSDYGYGVIELGKYGNGDRFSYLDFHSSGPPGSMDFSTRLMREPGANGNLALINIGTGALTLSTNNTERARIDSSGNLLVGYTSSNGAYKLQVNSQIFATSSTIATSDARYKKDVKQIDNALSVVGSLKPVQFSWKEHPVHAFDLSTPTVGFLAQEVQAALSGSEYVASVVKANEVTLSDGTKEEFLGISEGNLIPLLTAAIQEQQAIITAQAAQIQQLREKVLEVEEGTSNMLVENTNNLYETITALTARVAALEAA